MPWLHSFWWCFCLSFTGFDMLVPVHLHFDEVSFLNGLYTSVVEVKIYQCNSLYMKMIVILFCYWGTFQLACALSLGLCALLLWILLPQRIVSWCTWNYIYFYLALGFLDGITALRVSGFCCDLCHQHHILQLECHLLYQRNVVDLWIFNIFAGAYHLPMPPQKAVWWICPCQINMQIWLSMKIFYQALCCFNLSLHP